MTFPGGLWKDKDRRRALLLSVFMHLSVLLLLALLVRMPQTEPQESFIVINVGTPELAEETTNAPAADAPAPQAATPRVADSESGVPQTPEVAAPEQASQPEQAAQAALQPEAPQQTVEAPATEPAQAEPPPAPQAQPLPEPEVAETPPPRQTPEVSAPAPEPAVPEPATAEAPDLPVTEAPTSTALPEVEEPELEPLAQAVRIPTPEVTTQVPEARTITPTPNVNVADAREVPQPQIQASVAAERSVPQPQAEASVADARTVPQPDAQVSVAAPRSLTTTPQVDVSPTRSVATTPRVDVAPARSLAATPQVAVAPSRSLATSPQVDVAPSRSLSATPQVAVAPTRAVPTPEATAVANLPEPSAQAQPGAGSTGEAPGDATVTAGAETTEVSAVAGNVESNRPPGGNADRAGQTRADEAAQAAGLGAAAGPEGSTTPTGAPPSPTPYSDQRQRPLAVLLDNASGYPQTGLLEASAVYEMPVEGGLTRLMTVYDNIDPAQVGPVRSARAYFVEAARNMDAVLVHDGGAPGAMAAIARSEMPTFNAYNFGVLFVRDNSREAPYNLYSSGQVLRQAVNRLELGRIHDVSGNVFRPPAESSEAESVEVNYSGVYTSGFQYQPATNLYRWRRNGQPAVDASGEAVLVDAVVVARIRAQPIPGDTEGRLYIPLEGGEATLYLRGKAIPGRWTPQGGLQFITDEGKVVDLTPFKHWVLFAPQYAEVTAQ